MTSLISPLCLRAISLFKYSLLLKIIFISSSANRKKSKTLKNFDYVLRFRLLLSNSNRKKTKVFKKFRLEFYRDFHKFNMK